MSTKSARDLGFKTFECVTCKQQMDYQSELELEDWIDRHQKLMKHRAVERK